MLISLAIISTFMLLPGPAQDYLVDYTIQVGHSQTGALWHCRN